MAAYYLWPKPQSGNISVVENSLQQVHGGPLQECAISDTLLEHK